MRIEKTTLAGVCLLGLERHVDERGFFARSFCGQEMRAAGLESQVTQSNISFNERTGTLRGLHWQTEPHGECKIVRCTRGAIFDVAVDLRHDSPTHHQHVGVVLDASNRCALYVPRGVAHGFLTLEPDTEVMYLMSTAYVPQSGRGLRYDDPVLDIAWPVAVSVVSERDASWPLLSGG